MPSEFETRLSKCAILHLGKKNFRSKSGGLNSHSKLRSFVEARTRHNMRDPRAQKSAKFQRARASERVLLVFFERAGGQAPQLWEAWPSARARARALSTNQNFKITTFLLVNFKNDHGKSCSVSRDWQPPKISAQCVPISQSNDQKPISFNFKEPISAQFSHHF